jgi:hypothetical protein
MAEKLAALKALTAGDAEEVKQPSSFFNWWPKNKVRLLQAELAVKDAEITFLKAQNELLKNRVRELEENRQVPAETEQQATARKKAETEEINRKGREQMQRERNNQQHSSPDEYTPQMKRS